MIRIPVQECEEIYQEIKPELDAGKGCIILHILGNFPDDLEKAKSGVEPFLSFKFDGKEAPDAKITHHYLNTYEKCICLITRKRGRRLCSFGYPYFFDSLDDFPKTGTLTVEYGSKKGEKKNTIIVNFPLSLELTKERPVCALHISAHGWTWDPCFVLKTTDFEARKWHCWSTNLLNHFDIYEVGDDCKYKNENEQLIGECSGNLITIKTPITPMPVKPGKAYMPCNY